MYNSNTYFGTDGELTLGDVEGFDADAFTGYFGEAGAVGRVTNIALNVATEIKPFYELGSRAPKELRAGNIAIGGTVERAYINGALLRLMLGQYAQETETEAFVMPTFNMTVKLLNRKLEGDAGNSTLVARGVMFDGWQFNFPEDDFVLEKVSFQAKEIRVEDIEVPS